MRPQKIREEYDDTFTSVLGLRFEISRHHFRQGVIRLKCSSSLLTIYWQSSMVSGIIVKLKRKVKVLVEIENPGNCVHRMIFLKRFKRDLKSGLQILTDQLNNQPVFNWLKPPQ